MSVGDPAQHDVWLMGTRRRNIKFSIVYLARGREQSLMSRDSLLHSLDAGDPAEAAPSNLDGVRVVIVEDDWQVGIAMKRLVRSWGADPIGPFATVADTLREISERTPDVALVDIHLRNDERAYGLIDLLHERGIRVVVTTGYSDCSVAPEKVVAILEKPVDASRLLAILDQTMAAKASR